jgi:hypothetical protein
MSRLAIPITGRTLWTGDVRLWTDLALLVKDNAGGWNKEVFRVDSATDLTMFPAHLARQLNLPMPSQATRGIAHVQSGLEVRAGVLRFRIDGMDATEHTVACLFLGDPNAAPAGGPGTWPRKLLQPLALLDLLHFHFQKNATTGAPHGEMVIEKK